MSSSASQGRSADRAAAIIFDLDGTLADTVGDIAAAGNHALAVHGLPSHDDAAYRRMVGDGAAVLIERIVPADRRELVELVLGTFREYYPRHMLDTTRPYEGIEELLAALVACRVPMAVLSNKPEAMTRGVVVGLFGEVPFQAVWGQRPDRPKKPEPAAALALADKLSVAPDRCAFVGDTPVDMEAALRAGMVPVAVTWGFRPRAELEAAGARIVLERPAELLRLVDRPQ